MASAGIFEQTTRPPADVFFRRDDPSDPRLGEAVGSAPGDYPASSVVVLGCPQDEGVRRNQGRPGAALAPDEIRRYLYRLTAPANFSRDSILFDLGNTRLQGSLEETHAQHREVVRQVLRDGKRLVVFGGGNDVSYPDCAALALEAPGVLALNVDAHFDVRAANAPNSGTPYRQLLEEGYLSPDSLFEIGCQRYANSVVYRRYLRDRGVRVVWIDDLLERGVRPVIADILARSEAASVFWGLDLDSVRAADAPGVSAPNPTGLAGNDLCLIARMAGAEPRTRLIEFSEVNPAFDVDGRTCRLVAAAVFAFLEGLYPGETMS